MGCRRPQRCLRPVAALAFAAVMAAGAAPEVRAAGPVPRQLEGVTVAEHLGQKIDLDLAFIDHRGKRVALKELVRGDRPVLLTLNYYRCPMLCGLQLKALAAGVSRMSPSLDSRFRAITISIDPNETPDLAKNKRGSVLGRVGRPIDWTFMVGDKGSIERLARAVGFQYRYDEKSGQYAHPAVAFFLAPDGTVARYLYGLEYPPRELRFALMEASAGRLGSPVDKLILSCFQYDPATGRYAPFAFGIMRLAGGATLAFITLFILIMMRRERRRRRQQAT